MNTFTIALDSVIPADPTATAWARGYAAYLAAELTEKAGEDVEVKLGENSDYPADARDAVNRIYDAWCGMSDADQAPWIAR